MNRRGFFGAIAGLVAGATLDPERLLWKAGARLISIPPPPKLLLTYGDVFTISGYYAVNPVTRKPFYADVNGVRMRLLQRFVATRDITERGGVIEAGSVIPRVGKDGLVVDRAGAVPIETIEASRIQGLLCGMAVPIQHQHCRASQFEPAGNAGNVLPRR